MAYEYLVASLPMIFFEDPPPFSSETFRALCETELSAADMTAVERVLAATPPPPDAGRFEHDWHARETQVRNEAAFVRAARAGVEAKPYLRPHEGYDVSLKESVSAAFERPNPLERERELDRTRWRLIDEVVGPIEPFSLSAVLAYAAKLRIAERWAARTEESGRERLEAWMEGTGDE